MKTVVYFVRHAEPNDHNHDDMTRELSPKGMRDRRLVTAFLDDKHVDIICSSPYRRAIDTISDFAARSGLEIEVVEDFRERKIEDGWIDDFTGFCKAQWADFSYKLTNGESLGEVQRRNIAALQNALNQYEGKTIVVGSHGTALSTIIHYYDPTFGYEEFEKIRALMPWIVRFVFEDGKCLEIEQYNVFNGQKSGFHGGGK